MTEKFLMARNFFRIFTENNPVMGYSKTFFIPEAKGLKKCLKPSTTSFKAVPGTRYMYSSTLAGYQVHVP